MFATNSVKLLDKRKSNLTRISDVKLFGSLRSFIGWEICQRPDEITISQTRYTNSLITKHGWEHANGTKTTLHADIGKGNSSDNRLGSLEHSRYRSTIGELLYLAVCTGPDTSFTVCTLAIHVHEPTARHLNLLRWVLRYISGTRHFSVNYGRGKSCSSNSVSAFIDADWAGGKDTKHYTSGVVLTLHGALVIWKSQKQTVVALSSAEVECIAMSHCG